VCLEKEDENNAWDEKYVKTEEFVRAVIASYKYLAPETGKKLLE